MITICISHLCAAVVHYTQQKEIRSENPIVTEQGCGRKHSAQERQGVCYEKNFKYAERIL